MTLRFAALGDSITVGLGDPVPDPAGGSRTWRGWAALLADSLGQPGEVEFRNVAVSGALVRDVVESQLPRASAWAPHLVAVVVGVNDTLRGSFDLSQLARRLDQMADQLEEIGAVALTACLPEPGRMFGLPRYLARPLARRTQAINALVHEVATRRNVLHVHIAEHPMLYQRRMWSVDRLHPSEYGHRLLANVFHEALVARGWRLGPPPSLEATQPPPQRSQKLFWMATKGTQWVVRRSTDLLPQLIGLAVDEWRQTRVGLAGVLDQRMYQQVVAASSLITAGAYDDLATATTES